ncbi:MAG TPA: sulfatase-like hydrolase/transferase [Candidatus Limnocylindria bacterium]|nr:sulfatase-like hydrolase/transferase [Candidatus Limnocylindria bacterium]
MGSNPTPSARIRLRVGVAIATLAAVVLLGGDIARSAGCAISFQPQAHRPNIILVVADDLDVPLFRTLRRLTSLPGGRHFDEAFVTTPTCCPSKASMLRGQYAHSHGIYSNNPPNGGQARALQLGIESCTLATWLHSAGYETSFIGRYFVGYGWRDAAPSYVPPGWDHWMARVSRSEAGYDGIEFSVDGQRRTFPGNTDVAATLEARQLIAQVGHGPYFMMIATMAPHWPWPRVHHSNPSRRGALMAPVEEMVAQLLAAVDDDTYVIFTSDNGFHLVPRAGKDLPYDSDTKVPLIVWGPDVTPGTDTAHLVANIDFAPTIAELAGVTPPAFVEGRSLVPLLRGQEPPWRDELTLELVGRWTATRTATELRVDWANGRREVIPERPGSP